MLKYSSSVTEVLVLLSFLVLQLQIPLPMLQQLRQGQTKAQCTPATQTIANFEQKRFNLMKSKEFAELHRTLFAYEQCWETDRAGWRKCLRSQCTCSGA